MDYTERLKQSRERLKQRRARRITAGWSIVGVAVTCCALWLLVADRLDVITRHQADGLAFWIATAWIIWAGIGACGYVLRWVDKE